MIFCDICPGFATFPFLTYLSALFCSGYVEIHIKIMALEVHVVLVASFLLTRFPIWKIFFIMYLHSYAGLLAIAIVIPAHLTFPETWCGANRAPACEAHSVQSYLSDVLLSVWFWGTCFWKKEEHAVKLTTNGFLQMDATHKVLGHIRPSPALPVLHALPLTVLSAIDPPGHSEHPTTSPGHINAQVGAAVHILSNICK